MRALDNAMGGIARIVGLFYLVTVGGGLLTLAVVTAARRAVDALRRREVIGLSGREGLTVSLVPHRTVRIGHAPKQLTGGLNNSRNRPANVRRPVSGPSTRRVAVPVLTKLRPRVTSSRLGIVALSLTSVDTARQRRRRPFTRVASHVRNSTRGAGEVYRRRVSFAVDGASEL